MINKYKIIDIILEAQYQGTIYTQTILCELPNGQKISVFDSATPIITNDMVGKQFNLELITNVTDFVLGPVETKGLTCLGGDSLEYRGDIIDMGSVGDAPYETFCIDIGIGTIHLRRGDLDNREHEQYIGESITLHTFRTDVVNFH